MVWRHKGTLKFGCNRSFPIQYLPLLIFVGYRVVCWLVMAWYLPSLTRDNLNSFSNLWLVLDRTRRDCDVKSDSLLHRFCLLPGLFLFTGEKFCQVYSCLPTRRPPVSRRNSRRKIEFSPCETVSFLSENRSSSPPLWQGSTSNTCFRTTRFEISTAITALNDSWRLRLRSSF